MTRTHPWAWWAWALGLVVACAVTGVLHQVLQFGLRRGDLLLEMSNVGLDLAAQRGQFLLAPLLGRSSCLGSSGDLRRRLRDRCL